MTLSGPEKFLCIAGVALAVLAVALPSLPQDAAYHRFADARTLWGVNRALDTLSNVFFLVLGAWGVLLHVRGRLVYADASMRTAGLCFFLGMIASGLGSAYYHLDPDDWGLAWDRLGMVIAFAGVLGLAAADRVSSRAARIVTPLALVAGIASIGWFVRHGSVTPYAVLQFGGLALVAGLLWLPVRGRGPNWAALVGVYALAKVFEMADHPVFALSQGTVSVHTLKHACASLAVVAVVLPLLRPAEARATSR